MQRLTVEISGTQECGIIVKGASGIFYTRQTGGVNINTPEIEGYYLPCDLKRIGNPESFTDTLRHLFYSNPKYGNRSHEIDEETAAAIDRILENCSYGCRLADTPAIPGRGFSWKKYSLKVDRDLLHKSHEAWIFVTVKTENAPDLKGVLTWENSD